MSISERGSGPTTNVTLGARECYGLGWRRALGMWRLYQERR
jgi:hypothetical protein